MESNTCSGTLAARLDGLGSEALLALAGEAVRRAGSQPPGDGAGDAALVASVEGWHRLGNAVHAEVLRRVAMVEEREAYRGRARTSVNLWVERLGLARAEAKALVESAVVLGRLPETAARLAEGRLGTGHVTEAVRAVARLDRLAEHGDGDSDGPQGGVEACAAATVAALDSLVAGQVDPERDRKGQGTLAGQSLRRQLKEFEWEQAPALLAEREQRLRARRSLRLRRDSRDPDQQPLLDAALAPATFSKACNVIGSLARLHEAGDPRSFDQRCHDAFDQVLDIALASGQLPDLAGEQPRVLLVVQADTLHDWPDALAPMLDGYGPVSSATARQLCCDAEVTTVVVGNGDQILNVGRDRRKPNRAQRRAVFARDKGCIGCRAPLASCQIHHIRFWADGGRTDIDNLVAVCWDCHARIHHSNWKVVRQPAGGAVGEQCTAGQYTLVPPDRPTARPSDPVVARPLGPPAARPSDPVVARPLGPPAARPLDPVVARPLGPPAARPSDPPGPAPPSPSGSRGRDRPVVRRLERDALRSPDRQGPRGERTRLAERPP